jgi:hypothetical protein
MIKIGLFGAGHLGKIHLRLLKEIPLFNVIGFYDSNPAVAAQVALEFGVKAYDDPGLLLHDSEAVDIVTPTQSHYELAARAIRLHKHTFIEKPLVPTHEESLSLLHLAEQSRGYVQIGYVERFNPAFKAALPYIKNPLFIESHRLAEFNQRGTDVPVVLDLMIHDLDIIMHLVDSPIKNISATGVPVVSGSPDMANARIEFENGCVADMTASRIAFRKNRKTRIFQKDSYISIDLLHKQVEVYHLTDHTDSGNPMALVIGSPGGIQKQIVIERPEVLETNAIKQELEGFARAIHENVPPPVTITDGHASMEVAFRILDQIKNKSDLLMA